MIVKSLKDSFNPVPKTLQKSAEKTKKSAEIKKKSNKLAKLEKNRFSIITNDLEKCYFCGAKKKDFAMLAEKAMEDPCKPGNPRDVTKQDFMDLYEKAW